MPHRIITGRTLVIGSGAILFKRRASSSDLAKLNAKHQKERYP
jgi:hypothetical protein